MFHAAAVAAAETLIAFLATAATMAKKARDGVCNIVGKCVWKMERVGRGKCVGQQTKK